MKKMYLLVIMLVLFLINGYSAPSDKKTGGSKKKDLKTIYMLPDSDHHLTMIYNSFLKNIICRDDIFINLQDVVGKDRGSFVIDKHIFMQSIEIDGKSAALNEVFEYNPKDFGTRVRPFRLTQVKRDCTVYEFSYGTKRTDVDSIAITIRYAINPMEEFNFCKIESNYFKLDGNYLWFPNSLADSVNVNLEVITPSSYTVTIDNKVLPYVMNTNYIRAHQAVIHDNFKPLTLIGEKRER